MSTKVSPTFTNVASGFKCQTRSHSFYYNKGWYGKRFPFANVKKFCQLIWKAFSQIWIGKIQLKMIYRRVGQVWKEVLIEFAPSKWQKVFNISTFVIIKKLASEITLYGVVTQQFIQAIQCMVYQTGYCFGCNWQFFITRTLLVSWIFKCKAGLQFR